ncbi:pseudouridine synthase [Aquiflexum gelatinilyticum]|uniref:pseudouridine synthase n=1 Tax=Aquiflexum gelatinilyticum TaxID=2961943 RepID=UPI00216813FF|nr:pseudouridine synthase [Aquiflexum gelatinilyticum]MCS4435711.1 pseudouridine synthase [Aquiflexum gelatinilyticum]
MPNNRYFVLYKPFGILSQFSGEEDTLKFVSDFPPKVYPVGRLDKDSEGLLLITDDKSLNHHLLDPKFGHLRSYLAQVEGLPTEEAISQLQSGTEINVDGKLYRTKKAFAKILSEAPDLPERNPPIRYRKSVPDTWIQLTLTEGKNRQVRKMTAAVGYPTLRLVRWSMEKLTISGFAVGEVREYEKEEIYRLLNIQIKTFVKDQNKSSGKTFSQASVKRRK